MERGLCAERKKRFSDFERFLATRCICSLFGTCINLVLVKSSAIPEIHSKFDFVGDIIWQ